MSNECRRSLNLCVLITVLFLSFFITFPVQATLMLEGIPLEAGSQVENGDKVNLTVRVFDDEFSGKLLYEESQTPIVKDGKVTIKFKEDKSFSLEKSSLPPIQNLWVEVEYAGEVLSPRLNLVETESVKELVGTSQTLDRAGLRTAGDNVMIIGGNADNSTFYAGSSGTGPAAWFDGEIKITDGTQGVNKVLTSDGNGLASWQTLASGGGLWAESGADIYRSSGQVGIGTSAPAFTLEVQDSTSSAAVGVTATETNQSAYIYVDRGSSAENGDLIFRTSGNNKFFTGLSGYVGDSYIISTSNIMVNGVEVKETGDVVISTKLDVSGKISGDEIFCNSNMEVADELDVGNVNITGSEVHTTTTGATNNLLPFAYGTISKNGVKRGCTSNVGTITRLSQGNFRVYISGFDEDCTVIISPSDVDYVFITCVALYDEAGCFRAYVWDPRGDGNSYDGGFSFVVYKN